LSKTAKVEFKGKDMPIQKQISVFLANRPGAFARTCSVLSEAGINILAVAIHDSVDNGVARFVVDQPTKAVLLLEQEELYLLEQEVVLLEIDNAPGELTRISQTLAEADINISYAYCTAMKDQDRGCLVLRTDNAERALEILMR
jgi:hypothetical protein